MYIFLLCIIYRTIEIHEPADLAFMLKVELDEQVEGLSASNAATITHARPARPGKGKTAVKKFQADA
jgi:hypothetical protein